MSIESTGSNPYGAWWTSSDGIEGKQRAFSEDVGTYSQVTSNDQKQQKELNETSQSSSQ